MTALQCYNAVMNQRLHRLANEAAIFANQNSGLDRYQGHYWTTLFYEKYTQLLMADIGTIVKGDVPARVAYALLQSAYEIK